jgi:imidazolonepropionase
MSDLTIITNAREVITLAGGGPRCGRGMADPGIINNGAVAMQNSLIVAVGPDAEIAKLAGPGTAVIDAGGGVVMPGFVDAHTHAVFAGDRAAEFEQRLHGATYLEILQSGGGILSTVRETRRATSDVLSEQTRRRLATMLAYGTTTAEVKTGYGLELDTELKMLAVIGALNASQPVSLVPTFLAAHATAPEFGGRADAYIDNVISMIPAVVAWQRDAGIGAGSARGEETAMPFPAALFCDVFCDEGAFSRDQAQRLLQAAKDAGMGIKIHADEFANLGGAELAAELGAISADHLAVTTPAGRQRMAQAQVIAVLLPGTTFGLASSHYADARAMIECGLAVALGSDLNPGTCYCESMPFMIALACRYLKLTPAEAICAATINAAYATGVGRLVGSLEPGKQADIIILDLPDHRHLAYRFGGNPVAKVIKSGRMVC